ncbi:MAG TPA: LuxR C-terminal-related transcriptional regulator [Solirubrobacterales bacterium]|nr:LuxR C-terminal-related transcriptional regulator [Solirubrobacterales bacterium]
MTGEAQLLELIGDIQGLLDLDELADGLLATFDRNFPSDFVSINDVGPDRERVISVISPPQPEELYRAYGEYAFQNPLMARYMETLDGRAYRFSDVITVEEYHRLDLYRHVYGPMGVEHQIAFTLPATPGRILAIALSRNDPDYSDEERDLINQARPFLIQAWRNAIEHTALRDEVAARAPGSRLPSTVPADAFGDHDLTAREADVLVLVARGRSNRDAAAILGISTRTVQKHLEHCYRKLGVGDRSAASELVWQVLGAVPDDAEPRRGLDGRPQAG